MKEKFDYKKSLGQNFLFDKNLLNAIARDGLVEKNDTILEIGAGAGTLTEILAQNAKKVISFEIDKSLFERLNLFAHNYPNIEFYFNDFMQADIEKLHLENARVVANIPYYITTPIIFKLIAHINKFKSILVLIQKEVAYRFASQCGTKEYGITSVILQSIFDVKITRIVAKENFTPPPKIDSALCLLVPHNKYKINDFNAFKELIHKSFAMRRKTLVNNLVKATYDKTEILSALNQLNYPATIRPEQISVEDFIKLYNLLKK